MGGEKEYRERATRTRPRRLFRRVVGEADSNLSFSFFLWLRSRARASAQTSFARDAEDVVPYGFDCCLKLLSVGEGLAPPDILRVVEGADPYRFVRCFFVLLSGDCLASRKFASQTL